MRFFTRFSAIGLKAAAAGVLMLSQSVAPVAGSAVYDVVSEPTLRAGAPIPAPTGEVVLRVRGLIQAAPGADEIAFDMPTLERLGLVRFTTTTSWTEGPVTFEGVLLSSLLDVVGADRSATTLVLTALNDYAASIPASDAKTWPVMLAVKENGQYMSPREHGPMWVVYPQHAFPELGRRDFLSRWVWQLAQITVQ